MANLRRQKVQGFILLESLIGLAILVSIVTLLLGEFSHRQRILREHLEQEEALNVAVMAVQTKQDHLEMNGVRIVVERSEDNISVSHDGRNLIGVSKN